MFVGHLAVGLAAKRAAPRTSLGTLVLAALIPDLLLWVLVAAGIEHVAVKPGITATNAFDLYDYPISHSLAMDAVWGALFATTYFLARKYRRGSLLIFAAVLSHWVLDFASHRPDMPLAPGLQKYYGLGLYNSLAAMLVVEGLLWLAGIAIYSRATHSRGRLGAWSFWIGVAALTGLWVDSLRGQAPAGVSLAQMAVSSVIFVAVMVAWAYWVDYLRSGRADETAARPTPGQQAG